MQAIKFSPIDAKSFCLLNLEFEKEILKEFCIQHNS